MSDHDAHKALEAAARAHGLRILDPLELTQRMPVADRRRRQREAYGIHTALMNGYSIVVDELTAEARAVRQTPSITLYYVEPFPK